MVTGGYTWEQGVRRLWLSFLFSCHLIFFTLTCLCELYSKKQKKATWATKGKEKKKAPSHLSCETRAAAIWEAGPEAGWAAPEWDKQPWFWLQSGTGHFSDPSPIGNGINSHLKTSADFHCLQEKSPNSITQHAKSSAVCPLKPLQPQPLCRGHTK